MNGVVRQIDTGRVRIKVSSPTDSGGLRNRVGAASGGPSGPIESAFLSAAIEISPGTTVEWVWTDDSGRYHVVAKDRWSASGYRTEQGATVTRTFANSGVTRYYSKLHKDISGVMDEIN